MYVGMYIYCPSSILWKCIFKGYLCNFKSIKYSILVSILTKLGLNGFSLKLEATKLSFQTVVYCSFVVDKKIQGVNGNIWTQTCIHDLNVEFTNIYLNYVKLLSLICLKKSIFIMKDVVVHVRERWNLDYLHCYPSKK